MPFEERHVHLLCLLIHLMIVVIAKYFDEFIFVRMWQDIGKVAHVEKFFVSPFAHWHRILSDDFPLLDKIVNE